MTKAAVVLEIPTTVKMLALFPAILIGWWTTLLASALDANAPAVVIVGVGSALATLAVVARLVKTTNHAAQETLGGLLAENIRLRNRVIELETKKDN